MSFAPQDEPDARISGPAAVRRVTGSRRRQWKWRAITA